MITGSQNAELAPATDCIGSACTATITGQLPNTDYTLTLQASNAGGSSLVSDAATVSTISSVPSLSTGGTVAEVTPTSMLVQWDAASPNGEAIIAYILRACVAGGSCTQYDLGPSTLSYNVTGLAPADAIDQIFGHGRAVLLKLHPLHAPLASIYRDALAPLSP